MSGLETPGAIGQRNPIGITGKVFFPAFFCIVLALM